MTQASFNSIATGNKNLRLANGRSFRGGLLDSKDFKNQNFASSMGLDINNK